MDMWQRKFTAFSLPLVCFLVVACSPMGTDATPFPSSNSSSSVSAPVSANGTQHYSSSSISSFPKTVHVGNLTYTVIDMSTSTYVTDMGTRVQAHAGDVYLLLHMTIGYTSSSPSAKADMFIDEDSSDPNFPSMLVLKADGGLFYPDTQAQFDVNGSVGFGEGLGGGFLVNLGDSESGYIVFQVPKSKLHDLQLEVRSDEHPSAKSAWILLSTQK